MSNKKQKAMIFWGEKKSENFNLMMRNSSKLCYAKNHVIFTLGREASPRD
jgi:hypothetical protein